MRLLLASASPRRAALLAAAGFDFEVVHPDVDESRQPGEPPERYVERMASLKASTIARRVSGTIVIAADTAVVVDGELLGKPDGREEASRMLRRLSGRSHDVLTGVAIEYGSRKVTAVEHSRVRFLQLDEDEIAWYVASGEPFDKAGGYAVQGLASRFIDGIEGSYSNVVGLPIARVYRMLAELMRRTATNV